MSDERNKENPLKKIIKIQKYERHIDDGSYFPPSLALPPSSPALLTRAPAHTHAHTSLFSSLSGSLARCLSAGTNTGRSRDVTAHGGQALGGVDRQHKRPRPLGPDSHWSAFTGDGKVGKSNFRGIYAFLFFINASLGAEFVQFKYTLRKLRLSKSTCIKTNVELVYLFHVVMEKWV